MYFAIGTSNFVVHRIPFSFFMLVWVMSRPWARQARVSKVGSTARGQPASNQHVLIDTLHSAICWMFRLGAGCCPDMFVVCFLALHVKCSSTGSRRTGHAAGAKIFAEPDPGHAQAGTFFGQDLGTVCFRAVGCRI